MARSSTQMRHRFLLYTRSTSKTWPDYADGYVNLVAESLLSNAHTPAPQQTEIEPDLRARRFMVFAVALAQAANVLSVNTLIAVAGGVALLLSCVVREPPRRWYSSWYETPS